MIFWLAYPGPERRERVGRALSVGAFGNTYFGIQFKCHITNKGAVSCPNKMPYGTLQSITELLSSKIFVGVYMYCWCSRDEATEAGPGKRERAPVSNPGTYIHL